MLCGVFIGISAMTILLNVVEIILFARKRLGPLAAVVVNSTITAAWLGLTILNALGGSISIFSWVVIIVAL